MPRPKGSKNKPKEENAVDVLEVITKQLKSYGITPEDLSNHYKRGVPFNKSDLVNLFVKHKPELEKMSMPISRGRSAGSVRPLKEEEILSKFAEKIAIELNKVSPASSLLQKLTEQADSKPLKF